MTALLLLLSLGGAVASEVIAADQGTVAADQGSVPTQHGYGQQPYGHHAVHHTHTVLTREQYEDNMHSYSNATDWTMFIMMATVMTAYGFLFVVMFMTCCTGRGTPTRALDGGAFVRFRDLEAEASQSPMFKSAVVAELEPMWRKAFIAKVYSLLSCMILVSFLITFSMMQFGGYELYQWTMYDGAWTRFAALITSLFLICALFAKKNQYPHNLLLLLTFTCLLAYTIGVTCTAYAAAGLQMVVLEAFAITSIVFVGLTLFTMWSKIDFSFLGLILPILLLTLMVWGFFSMFAFGGYAFRQVYALGGTIIFSLYVLYDTWMITNVLSYDDYIIGAVNLYLDFINMFMFILQLLSGGRRD